MNEEKNYPLAAWFLGPKAEHGTTWTKIIDYIFQDYIHWRRNYFPEDQVVVDRSTRRSLEDWFDTLNTNIDQLLSHLKADYPFYSPRYFAHMLSEQSLPSVAGYIAGMLYNPNNVTPEAAPITVELEIEVGKMISEMLGFDKEKSWAHLCSGGTIANLEAMWVARISISVPLIVQEYCLSKNIAFPVSLADGSKINIQDADPFALMQLDPDESLSLPRQLLRFIINNSENSNQLIEEFNNHFLNSKFNINTNGLHHLYKEFDIEPIIIVSEAAHYCFDKVANLLGLGSSAIVYIPVDSDFRIRIDALKEKLYNLKQNQIIVGVVGILGTTEEGAIDPIDKIVKLRNTFAKEKNRSFWFHVDAAWGGYLRSILFQNRPNGEVISHDIKNEDDVFSEYYSLKAIEEKFDLDGEEMTISWKDPELFKALLFMSEANSITVDPHKLGYIPYPSGIISFRNNLVTEMLTQEAAYITDEKAGFNIDVDRPKIDKVGPYIIEGSKPGAAAASAWLAHKSIPLNNHSHGKLMRTSLLNTRRLHVYIENHYKMFSKFEKGFASVERKNGGAFTFKALCEPDSNILVYLALPCIMENGYPVMKKTPLAIINKINEKIYEEFSLETHTGKHKMPYGQDYFISKTRLEKTTYSAESIAFLLKKFGITHEEYEKEGIFVLRSTIMNPWYHLANSGERKTDYLMKFVKKLHEKTRLILDEMSTELLSLSLQSC